MRTFDLAGATHFCGGPQDAGVHHTMRRLPSAVWGLGGKAVVVEGSAEFDSLRTACLQDCERALFAAGSLYVRGAALLQGSAAPWAHVTLYYSGFFAAKAMLGMFGVWVDSGSAVTDVSVEFPGRQEVNLSKSASSGYNGPHQRFWDLFYQSALGLSPWIDASRHWVLQPLYGNPVHLASARNAVNYDLEEAVLVATYVHWGFQVRRMPGCLGRELELQYRVTDELVALAFGFASQLKLATQALGGLAMGRTRGDTIEALVFKYRAPRLAKRLRRAALLS